MRTEQRTQGRRAQEALRHFRDQIPIFAPEFSNRVMLANGASIVKRRMARVGIYLKLDSRNLRSLRLCSTGLGSVTPFIPHKMKNCSALSAANALNTMVIGDGAYIARIS